jgi:predicted RNA-binding Zn-ribbon protein involved in translation (DUF1610 family)
MNLKNILHPGKKPEVPKTETGRTVYCPQCGWKGTVTQSLAKNRANDTCPDCGNTELSYEI